MLGIMSDEHKKDPKDFSSEPAKQGTATNEKDAQIDPGAPSPELAEIDKETSGFSWSQAFVIIGLIALVVIAFSAYIMIGKNKERLEQQALQAHQEMVMKLNQELPGYLASQADADGMLTVNRSEAQVEFIRLNGMAEASSGWMLSGNQIVKVRVPVTYEAVVDTNGSWVVDVKENVARVIAPAVVPRTPPAIELGKIARAEDGGWVLLQSTEAQEVASSLESALSERARDVYLQESDAIILSARNTLEDQILTWLTERGVFKDPEFAAVKIVFPKLPEPKTAQPEAATDNPEMGSTEEAVSTAEESSPQVEEKPTPPAEESSETEADAPKQDAAESKLAGDASVSEPSRAPLPKEESTEATQDNSGDDTAEQPKAEPAADGTETEPSDKVPNGSISTPMAFYLRSIRV